MKRFAENYLSEWINRKHRKPLIIRGARQVGKSTLVRIFANNSGYKLIELNLERYQILKNEFASMDIKRILKEIEFGLNLGNAESAKTLLFLDEIQAIPEAIQCLRYFYEDFPHIPVIAAGSLLEFTLSNASFSMPVGRVEYLWLGPMTFNEFLEAKNSKHLINYFDNQKIDEPISAGVHESMLGLLREYFIVGGMPESVLQFVEREKLSDSELVLSTITQTYRDDFSKYSKGNHHYYLQTVFDFISRGAGEKIKYVNISREITSKDLENSLELLSMAQILTKVYRCDAEYPVHAGNKSKKYKIYSLDIGILSYSSNIRSLNKNELLNTNFRNKGVLAEQFICQHLPGYTELYNRPEIYYWYREGNNRNAEIDFILDRNNSIIPVEVKAGKAGSLKSLHQFCYQKKSKIALRFDTNQPSVQKITAKINIENKTDKVSFTLVSLPLYLVERAPVYLQEVVERMAEGEVIK